MQERPPTLPTAGRSLNRSRRWLLAAALAGLALRLAFAFGYWVGKPLTLDEQEYLLLARSMAGGRGFTYETPGANGSPARHFERPPVYPLFVAAMLTLSGSTAPERDSAGVPSAVKAGQSVLGAFAVWLVGIIAWRAAGGRAGALAAWTAAVYPPLVWICAYLLTEALYLPLALGAVWLLGEAIDRRTRDPRLWPVLAAGAIAGAAVLTREAMVFFLLLAGAWLAATRRLQVAAVLVAGAAIVVVPWGVRNLSVHGQIVLGSPHGGVTFWTGNNPLARGEGDMAANPDIKREQIAIEERHRGLTTAAIDSVYYREAFDYIRRHPAAWAWLMVRKAFYSVVPVGPSYLLHSARYLAASVVPYLAVLPFAVAGVFRLRRQPSPPCALWLMAASAVLVSLVFFPQERFRIPVIDPALIVCAAAWWAGAPAVAGRELT